MNNQIRFPSAEIDFTNDVGLTGQNHDDYAEPGTISRYDWMRIILLGLLANQASNDEPTNYRPGTIWYHINESCFKCNSGSFKNISNNIKVIATNLASWSIDMQEKANRFVERMAFSGVANDHTDTINIPESAQSIVVPNNRPFLYKNGLMIDPSLVNFNEIGCPVAIELSGNAILESGDKFTILIK